MRSQRGRGVGFLFLIVGGSIAALSACGGSDDASGNDTTDGQDASGDSSSTTSDGSFVDSGSDGSRADAGITDSGSDAHDCGALTACGPSCVNTTSDTLNCGSCDYECF